MNKIQTGVPVLDRELGGGIPEGYNIVVGGDPGSGKSYLTYFMLYSMMKQGYHCIFVTTDRTANAIKELADESGWEYTKLFEEGKLIFIDAHSWKVEQDSNEKYSLEILSDFIGLSKMMGDIRKNLGTNKVVEVVDLFSELFIYADENSVIQLLEMVCARARASKTVCFFVLNDKMQSEKALTSIEALTEGTIQCFKEGAVNSIEIKKMEGVPLDSRKISIPLSKGKDGIVRPR